MVLNPSVKAQLCSLKSSFLHLTNADLLVASILQIPFQIPYVSEPRISQRSCVWPQADFCKATPHNEIAIPSLMLNEERKGITVKRLHIDTHLFAGKLSYACVGICCITFSYKHNPINWGYRSSSCDHYRFRIDSGAFLIKGGLVFGDSYYPSLNVSFHLRNSCVCDVPNSSPKYPKKISP